METNPKTGNNREWRYIISHYHLLFLHLLFRACLIVSTETANCCFLFDLPANAEVLSGPIWSCSPPLFLLFSLSKQIVSIMFLNPFTSYFLCCPWAQKSQTALSDAIYLISTCAESKPELVIIQTLNCIMTQGLLPDRKNGSTLGKQKHFCFKSLQVGFKVYIKSKQTNNNKINCMYALH